MSELKNDYIQILKANPELYYTFISEDLEGIWKEDNELKASCLIAMFIHLSSDMDLNEITEEIDDQLSRHYVDEQVPISVTKVVMKIKEEKAGNN